MKSFKQHLDERCWPGYKPTPGKKAYSKGSCTKEEVELQEGRPSQRHPLEGHEYHKKSDEALIHIAKDAHAAAEAMKGHNTQAENKYRDQANDSATVRHFRKKSGMPDWYKKKYGHVKEEVELDEATGVTDYNPKSQGGTRKELLAKYHQTKHPKDAEAARKAGATQNELKGVKEEVEELEEKEISVRNAAGKVLKVASQFKDTYVKHGYKPVPGTRMEEVELDESEAWQRKEGQSESGGLNRKGIASYRAEHPGSKLSMAVTTKPSKLKKGSKAANRRKSFCARMSGMKKRLTSSKTANDPDSRINKSLRKWNC